jgi:hypothetical protein
MTRERTIAFFAFISGVAIGTLALAFTGSKNTQVLNDLAGSNRRARDKSEFLTGRSTRAWANCQERAVLHGRINPPLALTDPAL